MAFIVSDSDLETAVKEVINKILIPNFNRLNMNASGEWLDALRADKNTLLGKSYSEQLAKGREPGKRPPIKPLEKWVQNKLGISGKQATSIAFAISNTIAKEGTTWYKKGGSNLLEVLQTDEAVNVFKEALRRPLTIAVTEKFKREIKS
jgi:hypothetical protein